jgi:hypothetical protein
VPAGVAHDVLVSLGGDDWGVAFAIAAVLAILGAVLVAITGRRRTAAIN